MKHLKNWIEVVVQLFLLATAIIIPIYGAWRLAEWLFQ